MVCETAPRRIRPETKAAGFSLVELVVVIVVTGIIASVVGIFIAGPIQGFFDQARRAELVDAAQLALLRVGRDLRAALPNSVRISGGSLELLLAVDGDRYRTEPATGLDELDQLHFHGADASFNTFRRLGANQSLSPGGLRLAVYPLGFGSAADPYAAPVAEPGGGTAGVMTPAGIADLTVAVSLGGGLSEYRVTLSAGHRFPYESPRRRVFLVKGPVSWRCLNGDLIRYDNYDVHPAQPVPPADAGTVAATVVADIVQACTFAYDPGTAQRNAVATLSLTLADPAAPAEVVRLVRQVHVNNAP